jgi:hypothetical protein
VSINLRSIADRVDASQRPSRSAVASEIRHMLAAMDVGRRAEEIRRTADEIATDMAGGRDEQVEHEVLDGAIIMKANGEKIEAARKDGVVFYSEKPEAWHEEDCLTAFDAGRQ